MGSLRGRPAIVMEELAAKGVTFPIQADYYVLGSNQTAIDTATVLKQVFSDCLGDDYVQLNIKTYVSSLSKEVLTPQLDSFHIAGWGADYGDPQNYLGQETYGEDNAYYSIAISKINKATDPDLIATYKQYTELVNKANAIVDDMANWLLTTIPNNKRIFTIENGSREVALIREENGQVINSVVNTLTRDSENERQCITQISLLDIALRFNPDLIFVGEMRGAEANAAQEAARTGVAVLTTIHSNSCEATYRRMKPVLCSTLFYQESLLRIPCRKTVQRLQCSSFKKTVSSEPICCLEKTPYIH